LEKLALDCVGILPICTFGVFYGHLIHVCILWTFGTHCGNLVHFSRFGMLYREQSGNPVSVFELGFLRRSNEGNLLKGFRKSFQFLIQKLRQ
jgi:hypothetical protein